MGSNLSDWQSAETKHEASKQAMLGLNFHRLTGSKEAVMNFHQFGNNMSYRNIISYNGK